MARRLKDAGARATRNTSSYCLISSRRGGHLCRPCRPDASIVLELILHRSVNEYAYGEPMTKMSKTLLELEGIARVALRSRGATVGQVAIAPIATPTSDTNWMLLYVDGERAFDRIFEELIRPVKAQYDLSW
jgi:hypothetical protein